MPSNRQYLNHDAGSPKDVQMDDCESNTCLDNKASQLQPSSCSLDEFVKLLDKYNRDRHLTALDGELHRALALRDAQTVKQRNFERQLETADRLLICAEHKVKQKEAVVRKLSKQISNQTSHNQRLLADRFQHENFLATFIYCTRRFKKILKVQENICRLLRDLDDATGHQAKAWEKLGSLWHQIWDAYKDLTVPNSSAAADGARKVWDCLWAQQRVEALTKLQTARDNIRNLEGVVNQETDAWQEELDWATRWAEEWAAELFSEAGSEGNPGGGNIRVVRT